ncbi:MAG: polysaccharide pyruvyl transferase family protein [Lactobacillales bacterium]|nr:polysaccharide pyruvyl transferase family protein [Lactobacillales bacterium]
MEKVGIITIVDNKNFGNRLQNYALQEFIKKIGYEVETIKNNIYCNNKDKFLINYLKFNVKKIIKKTIVNEQFKQFNSYIKMSKNTITPYNTKKFKHKKFIVGSDQVWNPEFGRLSDVDLLTFANPNQKISYAASVGLSNLDDNSKIKVKKYLNKEQFPYLSVREESAKKIIEEITNRDDIKTVLDPTLMLDSSDWNKVAKKPEGYNGKKYILTYFLGNNEYEKQINELANKNDWIVINIKNNGNIGPQEFLYLFDNAEIIFTDSFHACAFSLIYKKKFFVFDRKQNGISNMNSRIINFLDKFNLSERRVVDFKNINLESINYENVYKILENERKKSKDFFIEALKK